MVLYGPLIQQQELRRARMYGLNRSLKVSQIIKEGVWDCSELNLPHHIKEAIYSVPIHRDMPDKPVWVPNNAKVLPSKVIYDEVRQRGVRGDWNNLIWFSKHIPKFSFVTWLVALGRINTLDKLRTWSIETDSVCLLCMNNEETRDHLFFSCEYS